MIYLLRHGETEWNRAGRYQGQGDSPLTARGEEQAREMGRRLKALLGDARGYRMVASPLGRCRRTAGLVCETLGYDPAAIHWEPLLMEIHYGSWEGLTTEEIQGRDPEVWASRGRDRWNVRVPGGESYALVAERAAAWLERIANDGPLIAVSHGGIGRVLRGLYLGLPRDQVYDLPASHGTFFHLAEGRITAYEPDSAL